MIMLMTNLTCKPASREVGTKSNTMIIPLIVVARVVWALISRPVVGVILALVVGPRV